MTPGPPRSSSTVPETPPARPTAGTNSGARDGGGGAPDRGARLRRDLRGARLPEIDPSASAFGPGSLPALADRTVTLNGLSKSMAMTGWRIGWSVAPGVTAWWRGDDRLQSQMTSGIPTFLMPAAIEALRFLQPVESRMREVFSGAPVWSPISVRIPQRARGQRCVLRVPRHLALPGPSQPGGRSIDSPRDSRRPPGRRTSPSCRARTSARPRGRTSAASPAGRRRSDRDRRVTNWVEAQPPSHRSGLLDRLHAILAMMIDTSRLTTNPP